MSSTSIEWTDATWNPVRGCVKVSRGCKHCYAETFAERWRGVEGHPYEQGFDPRLVPEKLHDPLRWREPRRVFVNSMSDLFGEFVPDEYLAAVFGVMGAAKHHTFQVLTKRAQRMAERLRVMTDQPGQWGRHAQMDLAAIRGKPGPAILRALNLSDRALPPWPLPNVHLGVSVEDRRYGVPRIDALRSVPAALRFLSVEPLIEDLGELNLAGIGWVIVGGESGPDARPMHEGWVRSLRDQCVAAGVPFFYKQRVEKGRKVSLPVLDGRQHAAFPEVSRG